MNPKCVTPSAFGKASPAELEHVELLAFHLEHVQGCVSEPVTDPCARAVGEAGESRWGLGVRAGMGHN